MESPIKFVIVAGVSACGLAHAQSLSSFYFRGGALWPFSAGTRGDATNYGFVAGVGYMLEGPGLGKVGGRQGSVEFDFSHLGGGLNIETYDVEYAERFSLTRKYYVGAGVGVRYAHYGVSSSGGVGGSGGGGFTNHQTTYVGEILVGYQVSNQLSVELSAKLSPTFNTESTSEVTLLANFKF